TGGISAFLSRVETSGGVIFLLGACSGASERLYEHICSRFCTPEDIKNEFERYAERCEALCGNFVFSTGNSARDAMLSFYLPYQALYTRMLARTGLYQSSGAYGFRDQLQDSLAAMRMKPELTKVQLYRSAAHQFTDGTAMHWWHFTRGGDRGVRSRCSDDYLWLPYVCARYIDYTGDETVLSAHIYYRESPHLADSENERYEIPQRSELCEDMYSHCIRAIEHALVFGEHGLPFIGSCDWNDGMNAVGDDGRGESVWLAFFLAMTLADFSVVCDKRGDTDRSARYRDIREKLLLSVNENAYGGDRYLRAYFDNGTPLGAADCAECAIDILPQAFSAIVSGKTKRTKTALHTMYDNLFDSDNGIMCLLAPSFDRRAQYPGYIAGYVPGIRENGGQYTHAAVWAAWGLFEGGMCDAAFNILCAIDPAERYDSDSHFIDCYLNEPYALSGDVYYNRDHIGRGGWSHYTGAAAWYYGVYISEVLGFELHGTVFTLNPKICGGIEHFRTIIKVDGGVWHISVSSGDKTGYISDGKIVNNVFHLDKSEHFIEITVEK
ncbi:MAG: glycosyl transferase family 36, partial [Eubacteriales bacterium]